MIDTAEKRFSMLNFGDGDLMLFEVDGAVDLDDRQHLLGCYSGIAFAAGENTGTLDVTLGAIAITASGTVASAGNAGSLTSTLDAIAISASGSMVTLGSLAKALESVTILASGTNGDVVVLPPSVGTVYGPSSVGTVYGPSSSGGRVVSAR